MALALTFLLAKQAKRSLVANGTSYYTASRIREKQKLEHYENTRQTMQAAAVTVVAFIIESTGALGDSAMSLYYVLCKLLPQLAAAYRCRHSTEQHSCNP